MLNVHSYWPSSGTDQYEILRAHKMHHCLHDLIVVAFDCPVVAFTFYDTLRCDAIYV